MYTIESHLPCAVPVLHRLSVKGLLAQTLKQGTFFQICRPNAADGASAAPEQARRDSDPFRAPSSFQPAGSPVL